MNTIDIRDNIEIAEKLEIQGFALIEFCEADFFEEIVQDLGVIIQTTDVRANKESKALVTSDKALDLHTDHHKADFIAWYCVEQSEIGGESIILDGLEIYNKLNEKEKQALKDVQLMEHKVFHNDKEKQPLIEIVNGQPKIYYSFWLVEEPKLNSQKAALNKFQYLIKENNPIIFKLKPNQALIIDNRRVLHGRSAIKSGERLLKRYWIKSINSSTTIKKSSNMEVLNYEIPEAICKDRIAELTLEKNILQTIAEIDLEMVKMKLQDAEEGKGWTIDQCEDAEIEYKRFLHLNKKYPNKSIVPNTIMDTFWHYHILDTRAYFKDSDKMFGYYFHHFPYFGMRGKEDEQNLTTSFEETKKVYEKEFGEPMLREGSSKCWHSCQSRCWHKCSSK